MHTNLSAKFRTALVVLLDRYFSLCFCLCSPTGVRCITYPSFNHSSADVGRLSTVARLSWWSKVTVTHLKNGDSLHNIFKYNAKQQQI